MEGLAPITFDLEDRIASKGDFAIILDCIYKALFHEEDARRLGAIRKLDAMFSEENFKITILYCGDNQLFLRATCEEEDAVFYVGEKPKNYLGKSLDLMNSYFITLQNGGCKPS